MNPNDYTEWLRTAYAFALHSPDPSTQNGAVAINHHGRGVSVGCNTFPSGLEVTPEKLERPLKYSYIEHAERNALYGALRGGDTVHTLVCVWASCADCARAIVQSGVTTLVRHAREDLTGRWIDSIKIGDEIMLAGGVEIVEFTGPLGGCEPVLFDGQLVTP